MNRAPSRSPLRRAGVQIMLVAGVALFVVALGVFEPWKLVINRTVQEAPPEVVASANPDATRAADPGAASAPGPVVLARGRLVSHEHASTGSVAVLRLADNSRVLRLEDLRTSDGPRLRVWLSAAPVIEGRDGWHVFDDAPHVDLGELKGNIGSSNYVLPAEVDLVALPSVTIWCERFHVSFAAAALSPA